jgi:Pyruvate/2-oxoacid:ferredoxin oxidoreductase gamma subunit
VKNLLGSGLDTASQNLSQTLVYEGYSAVEQKLFACKSGGEVYMFVWCLF